MKLCQQANTLVYQEGVKLWRVWQHLSTTRLLCLDHLLTSEEAGQLAQRYCVASVDCSAVLSIWLVVVIVYSSGSYKCWCTCKSTVVIFLALRWMRAWALELCKLAWCTRSTYMYMYMYVPSSVMDMDLKLLSCLYSTFTSCYRASYCIYCLESVFVF